MADVVLINGMIVTATETFKGAVFINEGKISRVVKGDAGEVAGNIVDLDGKHVLPGAIDVHVHFRTPGNEEKEDWVTGSKAALAGGVTTVLDMPNNNPPVIDADSLGAKRAMVKDKALINYGFYVGATPDNLDAVKDVGGVAGIKVYMGSSTGNLLVDRKEDLERFMAEARKLLVLHAEDERCIVEGLDEHKDKSDPKVHSVIRNPECAHSAVKEALHLAKKYNARVHIAHLSTEQELETVRKFNDENVSVEVTPHHLFLSETDYKKYGNLVKVNPPLRGMTDQVKLWEGIKDGTVDMVASDHAPHLLAEKQKDYDEVPSGIPGVQTMLPLLLNEVSEGRLTLEKVVELTSFNPVKKFGIKGKGVIEEGADADLIVVDMNLKEKIDDNFLWSKCGWSPFSSWDVQGWPVMTFVGGNLMYEWRDAFHEGKGSEVEFE